MLGEAKTVGAIVSAAGAVGSGSVTVATITAPAPGILGVQVFSPVSTPEPSGIIGLGIIGGSLVLRRLVRNR